MARTKPRDLEQQELLQAYGFETQDFADIRLALMKIINSEGTTPDEVIKAARVVIQAVGPLLSVRSAHATDHVGGAAERNGSGDQVNPLANLRIIPLER